MDFMDCAASVIRAMEARDIETHSIHQLLTGMRQEFGRMNVDFEQSMAEIGRVVSASGKGIDVTRIVDIVAESASRAVHTEIKTGYESMKAALKPDQLLQDAAIAIDNMRKQVESGVPRVLENVWKMADLEFNEKAIKGVGDRMTALQNKLLKQGFSDAEIQTALGSFNFVDATGRAIRAQLTASGDLIFKDAAGNIFGPDGKLAQAATKEAKGSPNFAPAMDAVLGPDGKLATAARGAANAANLDPAMAGLEQKIESGVTTALDEAGAKAQAHAASKLGANIKEGVGALGNTLSSVAGLGNQVLQLGEAWNKPKKGAADYFNLMGQFGGTISQGLGAVDAIQKLGAAMSSLGIMTKIAAAAQAVFNAIMAINPVVLIVLAVVALIAAIVALIVYWDQVKAALRDNPWLAVVAALFGVIGVIVLVIAYWDEIKLAVLIAANFMSIQLQKIGGFFIGLKNVIVMVWDWVVASVYNLGVGILNTFIEFGAGIVNFFIDLLNDFIEIYNDIAYYVPGLDEISKVERVNVEAIKVAAKEVPEIDVGKAFAHQGEIKGGLEDQIAKQEQVVAKAQDDDRTRQQKAAQEKADKAQQAAPALPAAAPALPGGFGGPAPADAARPAGGPDQSVHVEGGIHVTINAEGLDSGSAKLLTDDMVRQIQERLDSLRSERDRRIGVRTQAAA